MMPVLRLFVLLGLLLAAATPALGGAGEERLDEVRFIPQWVPQAQFAGFYMAAAKGLYRQHGLRVTILAGGPDHPPSQLLLDHQAEFGTLFLSRALQLRAQGVPLVNLAQLVQRSALMLVARRGSGITRPEDLAGRRVGMWGEEYELQPRAFFRQYGLPFTPVSQGTTVNLFLRGGVEVTSAMWYNEYHLLLNAGLEPNELTPFFFFDHNLNFPEDGIYCLAATWQSRPELCRRFVAATLAGWQYAFAHPDETVSEMLRLAEAAKVVTNRTHQRWMLDRMRDIILPATGATELGQLRPEDYQRVGEALQGAGLLKRLPPFGEFFVGGEGDG